MMAPFWLAKRGKEMVGSVTNGDAIVQMRDGID
jgi:hypothetical protein